MLGDALQKAVLGERLRQILLAPDHPAARAIEVAAALIGSGKVQQKDVAVAGFGPCLGTGTRIRFGRLAWVTLVGL